MLKPTFGVLTSTNVQDPTTKIQFELYSDVAMTQLVESALVNKAPAGAGNTVQPTTWQPTSNLNDNTKYWWRARGYDGTQMYSLWSNGQFKVNLFNDPPDIFNLTNPAPSIEVGTLLPTLAWTNAFDKDGDVVTYTVRVYKDVNLTILAAEALNLPADPSGTTTWTAVAPLTNHVTYYWKVIAKDAIGAETHSPSRPFKVNTGNTAPTMPVIVSPVVGGQVTTNATTLLVQNSTDPENDPITYVFEYDTVNTFDSVNKRISGVIPQSLASNTGWAITGLVENMRYYWRAKATDGHADSSWVIGDFQMNAVNDAPPAPTVQNPGNGAWSSNRQPTLDVNAVVDPEGGVVRYEFEIYKNAALTQLVTGGVSDFTTWIVPVQLADKTTHWWRARAVDSLGATSAWTSVAILYVSSGSYQNPTIQVISPSVPTAPSLVTTAQGVRKVVTINWLADDPNIEPTIALYYSNVNTGFSGNLIVDGLRQSSGSNTGNYAWDVTSLPVGNYYVYAIVYDAKGLGKAYAAGSIVIPPATQLGRLVVTAAAGLVTTEAGGKKTFNIKLFNKPTANVIVPIASTNQREGIATPNQLTFTPLNWSTNQLVTVTGQPDCANDGSVAYQVLSGKAESIDPQYIGLSGVPVNLTNSNNAAIVNGTTNNTNVLICAPKIVTETAIPKTRTTPAAWVYVLKVDISNVGVANMNGIKATLTQTPFVSTKEDAVVQVGAINAGQTISAADTITLRTATRITQATLNAGGFVWNIVVTP